MEVTSPLINNMHICSRDCFLLRVLINRKARKDFSPGKVGKMSTPSTYHTINASEWIIPFCITIISRVPLKKFGFILLFSVTRSNKHHEFLINSTRLLGLEFTKLYITGHVQLTDFRCCGIT